MSDATYHVVPSEPRREREARGERLAPEKKPIAILVAHGMGQQTHFQTLDDLVTGLHRYSGRPRAGAHQPNVKTVQAGQERLQRVESTLILPDGSERDVHIYEAYWAPLTEGQVTLRDVIAFLLRGGATGTIRGLQPFRRWLFDQYVHFAAPVRTVLHLAMALGAVASLVVLNAIIVGVAVARAPLQSPPSWLSPLLFGDLTSVVNALVCVFAVFAAVRACLLPHVACAG